jgi:hypothetical protein
MAVKQLSVFIENRPGTLVEVTEILAAADIDIRALSLAETPDYGILRLIVDKTERACEAVRASGRTVTVNHMVGVRICDRPGGLSAALRLLAGKGFEVEYMYAFLSEKENEAEVVLRVKGSSEDRAAAEKALAEGGFDLIV